jgi:hypothetical protein
MTLRGGIVGGRTAISAKIRYGWSGILLSIALVIIFTTPAILPDGVHYLEPDRQPRFANSADDVTGEWVQRFSQILSGTLDEKGEERGGRVCYPDCPSGVEVDEYDLWEFAHPGRIAEWQLSDVGELGDSTTTIVESCFGYLWDMYCRESGIEGNQRGLLVPKSDGSSFIRISPIASLQDDDVDYTIGFVEEYWDAQGWTSPLVSGYARHFSIEDQYVCLYECHEDDGWDAYDLYSVHLYAGEHLELNIHTYPDPNRGQISAFLVGDQEPYQQIKFHDEEEWTFHLRPLSPTTYKLIIVSHNSDAWDGMTYDITATLWWSSITRDPNADYDGDGWTDFTEDDCNTGYLSASSLPPDYDGDWLCNLRDPDDDNDGVADVSDDCPMGQTSGADHDGDGCKDTEDTDDDNDGVADVSDDCPIGQTSGADHDGDGCKDTEDTDDDNDGVTDSLDAFPMDGCADTDTDGDGMPDTIVASCTTTLTEDADVDNDGVDDVNDDCPYDAGEQVDTDGDGYCDNQDTDDDNDGVADVSDEFPLDGNEWVDTDGNGVGDNADAAREQAAAQTRVFASRAAAVAVTILYAISVIRRLE